MARKKSTPRRIKHTPAGPTAKERKDLAPWLQPLDDINNRVFDRVATLQCVLKAIEASHVTDTDDDLGAAEILLRRTVRELNGLHSELDLLHGDLRYGREPREVRS